MFGNKNMHNLALSAFVNVIGEIRKSDMLQQLLRRNNFWSKFPGFTVRMGFGLHIGWAIEGAIGSEVKIDASYLSPHVNIAARLEAATKMYGIDILVSEAFYEGLGSGRKSLCRVLDRVAFKGSSEPMYIYTYDTHSLNSSNLSESHYQALFNDAQSQHARQIDLSVVREMYNNAVQQYIDGKWAGAAAALEQWIKLVPKDNPAQNLLNYLKRKGLECPAEWPGYRKLERKN